MTNDQEHDALQIAREALQEIAVTAANANSDPDVAGVALDNAVATAQGALRAIKELA